MICKYCGKEFQKYKNVQKFCKECRELWHRRALMKTKLCVVCGKEIPKGRSYRYCSAECKQIKIARERVVYKAPEELKKPKKKPTRPALSLEEVVKRATAGLSYGQYCEKYNV